MKVLQGIMAWDIVIESEEEPEDPRRPNDFTRPLVLARKAYKDYKQQKLQAVAIIYGSCTNAGSYQLRRLERRLHAGPTRNHDVGHRDGE